MLSLQDKGIMSCNIWEEGLQTGSSGKQSLIRQLEYSSGGGFSKWKQWTSVMALRKCTRQLIRLEDTVLLAWRIIDHLLLYVTGMNLTVFQ